MRYEADRKPEVEQVGDKLKIKTWDYMLNREIVLDADWLVLSDGSQASPDDGQGGRMYKVTRNPDGYFLEAHVKLRPVDFPSEGIFVTGPRPCAEEPRRNDQPGACAAGGPASSSPTSGSPSPASSPSTGGTTACPA
ncbi:MAG: hypothetical protein MZV70_35925 [Desulfobacterales bacterium]|nr:hypothetical protein [Desulfobacterales bacterium]